MKDKIDKFLTDNYEKLLHIAYKKVAYFNRPTSAEAILNDAYLYVVHNPPELIKDIPRYMVNHINMELRYTKSYTTRRDRITSREVKYIKQTTEIDIDSIDIKNHITEFRNTLCKVDQIVWDVYTIKDKRKVREISEHFGINMSSAQIYRTKVLTKFKKYYENQTRV